MLAGTGVDETKVLYGRFPFAALGLFVGPLLVVVSVATYVLATTNSSAATLAAQIACAIAGFVLVLLLPGFVILAASAAPAGAGAYRERLETERYRAPVARRGKH